MLSIFLVILGFLLFFIAYVTYGSFIAKKLGLGPKNQTPAHTMKDGIDYVPAKAPVVLGHHFASIAGAGPIVGPILATVFGWLPVYLWIVLGGIFIGAVHDFTAVVASLRHKGKTIGEIIEDYIGRPGKILFLLFAWFTMLLVVAVFTRIVAQSFINVPSVATSSLLFIALAVVFGLAIYRRRWPLLPTSIIGVALLALCIYLGGKFPLPIYKYFETHETRAAVETYAATGELQHPNNSDEVKTLLRGKGETALLGQVEHAESRAYLVWVYVLLIYVFMASVTPIWILLQPRDYLNSFLLYALLVGGMVGVFFVNPGNNLAPFTSFKTDLGLIFPVLFVTVACGAISGFHSLVASGTTSKQIDREPDAKIIGYGGMLIESVLAILALVAAAALARDRYQVLYQSGGFITIFSEGVGWFISKIPLLGVNKHAAITFSALAVSAFALTSLDTATRIGRFTFQELFDWKNDSKILKLLRNRYVATAITVFMAWSFIISGTSQSIWPIFGSANQMLAALALLAVSAWLIKIGKNNLFTLIPLIFMYGVTLTALVTLIYQNYQKGNHLLTVTGVVLFGIAVALAGYGYRSLWPRKKSPGVAPE